jgi:hypothetical protein
MSDRKAAGIHRLHEGLNVGGGVDIAEPTGSERIEGPGVSRGFLLRGRISLPHSRQRAALEEPWTLR